MNAFSVPPNYVASLQENLTDDVLRSPNADPLSGRSGHNITGSSEYWRLTMLANSQAD
jgi:hypothetical protein